MLQLGCRFLHCEDDSGNLTMNLQKRVISASTPLARRKGRDGKR